MKRIFVVVLSVCFIILVLYNCKDEPPTPPDIIPGVKLFVVDVDLTEVTLKVETKNINLPSLLRIFRDDTTVKETNIDSSITVVTVDSLQPNKTYNFQAVIYDSDKEVFSNVLSVSTLDTTSQNFTFEFLEFGDGFESSYFNDVWVFDENNIWAVGYISPADTIVNGNQIINPNIIKWDGTKWELEPFNGTSSGIDGIWAVNTSKIYFANGIVLKYENGNYRYEDFSNVPLPNGQRVEKLWGSSENNIYGVGPWGTIVWYNGVQWTKIEFDTQWSFFGITGNKETGVGYAVAISPSSQYDAIVVKLENLVTSIIYQKSLSKIKILSRTITGYNNDLYIAGSDVQSTKICKLSRTGEIEILHHLSPFIGIKQSFALNKNDLFFAGDEGFEARLIHYNGVRYSIFNIPQVEPNIYGGIHAIKDLAVSVGFTNNKAYIIKIRRQ